MDNVNDQIDIRAMLDVLLSRRTLILSIFLFFSVAGTLYALTAPSVYQSDALIQVEEKKSSEVSGLQQIAGALDIAQSPVAGEIEILKSRDVLGKAIAALNLQILVTPDRRIPVFANYFERHKRPNSQALAAPKFGLESLAWGGESLSVGKFDISDSEINSEFSLLCIDSNSWELRSGSVVVGTGQIGHTVNLVLNGEPIALRVDAMTARSGQSFTVVKRSFVATYGSVLKRLTVAESGKQSSVIKLSAEGSDPNGPVLLLNEIARAYLLQNIAMRTEESEKSLEFLAAQIPEVKQQADKSEQELNTYRLSRQSVNLDKEADALLTRSVDLERSRVEIDLKLRQAQQSFQSGSPVVNAAQDQLKAITSEEQRLGTDIQKLPETQQEIFRLQRDATVSNDLYVSLLNSMQQLKIAKAGTVGNVRVIDFATPPDLPIRPRRTLIVGLTAGIGLFVAIFSAFIARAIHPTLRTADELERISGLPTYAVVPNSPTQKKLLRARLSGGTKTSLLERNAPNDPAVEALRGMRMGLEFALVGAKSNVIVITGATPGIGKTFISVNLASVLASAGKKILIIDTDMRRPRLHEYVGLKRTPGLSNYLLGDITLDAVAQKTQYEGLTAVCSGLTPPNPAELLLQPSFTELLAQASARFDYVLLDTPPLLPVGDTLSIAREAGAVFMVARAEQSTIEEFFDAVRKLGTTGITPKGTIFNGVVSGRLSYGYQYAYGYLSAK